MERKAKEIHLYVGTKKGGFLFRSDLKRKHWKVEGPFHAGSEVTNLYRDPRSGHLWSGVMNGWFGPDLQVSTDRGKTWKKSSAGIEFSPERKLNLARVWRVAADRDTRPDVLWCGVDPGTLFRSDNGGKDWYEVRGLSEHPSHEKWVPGGGGMMVHAIIPDRFNPKRIHVGVSVGGFYRSDDDGKTWKPLNKNVLADFQPNNYPEFGQCVHSLVASPKNPNVLYQQNHCGVYSTTNGGEYWNDLCKGLPSRFGFPIAISKDGDDAVYVIPEDSPERRYVVGGKLTVYKTTNGGRKWQKLTNGLQQQHAYTQVLRHGLDADGDDGVYFGTTNGELYYTRNGGKKWEVLQRNLPPVLSVHCAAV